MVVAVIFIEHHKTKKFKTSLFHIFLGANRWFKQVLKQFVVLLETGRENRNHT
jgi:hypothetical protein